MADTFIPGPDRARALRGAFGRFATGVTVVTTTTERGPIGITANSFTSVSLDPPLLLWCPAKTSQRHDAFVGTAHFALHVMGTEQDAITWAFANTAEAFEHCDCSLSEHGVPLIAGCPVRFECTIRDRIDAGDHTVIIAHIDRVTTEDGPEARVFLGGDYGHFSAL
ncbi:flavin reductase family protein [Sinisalibacter aestuarii]|uniref:Flavin oxidoreductase n=1 Tax=Sinisalibacter aestuarii TaxID=2949426 RepID=A0ABQ5LXE1_9RHOB|nr:flavin reductase family protein [Sinisalibacter aestuarii]GKY89065.1 flavin oxidoreductase [Sinisalibacter aestuarii]